MPKFGQEGTFRCADHKASVYERQTTEAHEYPIVNRVESNPPNKVAEKENQPPNTQKSNSTTWILKSQVMMVVTQTEKGDDEKKKVTREHGLEYLATEILLLSKAWISASENKLTGVHQKINTL